MIQSTEDKDTQNIQAPKQIVLSAKNETQYINFAPQTTELIKISDQKQNTIYEYKDPGQTPEGEMNSHLDIHQIICNQEKINQYTEPQLKEYDKMLHKWRQIQRGSLAATKKQQKKPYTYDSQNYENKMEISKPASEKRNEVFEKYLQEIHHYLKAKFIMQELIQPISSHQFLDYNQLKNIQFIYLICFRAWCQINMAKESFEKKSTSLSSSMQLDPQTSLSSSNQQKIVIEFDQENQNLKYLIHPIFQLSSKIDQKFKMYQKALNFKQKTFLNKLKNLKNYFFHYNDKNQRDKFLFGFEVTDFTRPQQIQYTCRYLDDISKGIIKKIPYEHKYQYILPRLGTYKQTMNIFLSKMEGFDDFQTYKQTLRKQWKERQLGKFQQLRKKQCQKKKKK